MLCYEPRPSAQLMTLTSTLIISEVKKPHTFIFHYLTLQQTSLKLKQKRQSHFLTC